MGMTYIVTGTDTGIGKTVFSAALCHALKASYWKPVQAGLDEETDTEAVARLAGCRTLPEAYRLSLPASPHAAAAHDGVQIDTGALAPPETDGPLVVEGAGGLMVPLTRETLFIDLFARWQHPVILCARTALGTINHSLLSIAAMRKAGCPVHGIAFIGDPVLESENIICAMGKVRRLGRLPFVEPLSAGSLHDAFAENFDRADFAVMPVAGEK